MFIDTITVTYGRKINLGNYNNANIEVTIGATLEDEDNYDEVQLFLWETAKSSAKAQVMHLVEASKPRTQEDF